jgi:hypothetical protein
MTKDELRTIIHTATHEALPPAPNTNAGVQERARIQVKVADALIARLAGAVA